MAGYENAARYTGSVGRGAIGGAAAGAAIGSVIPGVGTVIGAAGGAVLGGASSLFQQIQVDSKASAAAAEQLAKAIAQIGIQGESSRRSIARMDSPKELKTTIDQIAEKMLEIKAQAEAGIIPQNLAKQQLIQLQSASDLASLRMPGAERKAAEDQAAKNLSAIQGTQASIQSSREKTAFDISLSGAKDAADKISLIDARFALLTGRAQDLASKLEDPKIVNGPEDGVNKILSQIEQLDSELSSLNVAKAGIKELGPAVGETFSPARADQLTKMGAILSGSGLSGAANDFARSTSNNTQRMVSLLELIATRPASEGGATWAA
jgi:hypothetical protein